MNMSSNVTYGEYAKYVSDAAAEGNSFLSQTLDGIKQGAIAESQRLGATADALAKDSSDSVIRQLVLLKEQLMQETHNKQTFGIAIPKRMEMLPQNVPA